MKGERELIKALEDILPREQKVTETAAKRLYVITKANIITRSKNGGNRLASSVTIQGTTVTVTAPYAVYVEEGTSKQVGKHFFSDAINSVVPEWFKNLHKNLKL